MGGWGWGWLGPGAGPGAGMWAGSGTWLVGWRLGLASSWRLRLGLGKGLKRQFEATLKMADSSGGQFGLGVVVLWWSVLWSSWCSKL